MLKRKGFTLMELMLSAAILALALTGIVALFLQCMILNEANRNSVIALSHAQFAMEEIKNLPFNTVVATYPPAPNPPVTWDSDTVSAKGLSPLGNESIIITTTVIDTGFLDVTVDVKWKDRGTRDRDIYLATQIVN